MAAVDYGQLYDEYWKRPDRIGSHSFSDPMEIVRAVLQVTGPTRVLDIGSGMGSLVLALLKSGCDAQGIDASSVAVEHANKNAPGRYQVASALALPFPEDAFPTVISTDFLEHLDEGDVAQALKEMWRVCTDTLYLRVSTAQDRDNHWHLTVRPRNWWEEQLILAGFRKHPKQLDVIGYEEIETEGDTITLVMQKIPALVCAKYPIARLQEERQLHMDMTRDPGRRSDAHIVRYKLAREFIRPGDTVLDIACGLGYGAEIMAYGSGAARIIGVDNSAFAIDYATGNFGAYNDRLEFRCEDGADLKWLDDSSIDYVVSMETLEHLPDPERFLAEIARVLKPAGRVFVSVPNMWVDETGQDPNPHHLHVYDLVKLKSQLGAHFQLEGIWEQTAGGAFKLPEGKRRLQKVDIEASAVPDPEWWLCLAMKSPLAGNAGTYVETVHITPTDRSSYVVDFASWYDNPYLYAGLVNRGARLRDPIGLTNIARNVVSASADSSPDLGAALCVLAYATLQALDSHAKGAQSNTHTENLEDLTRRISAYLDITSTNPHVKRWQISLAYVLGLILLARGSLSAAESIFRRCVSLDPLDFSPLIATKTLAASLALADIELARDDRDAAHRTLTQAVERAMALIGRDWPNVIGSAENPLTFGFIELAEVCDLAAKCALQAEALKRGWSKAFAHMRGRMSHQDQLEDLRLANFNYQKQLAWWQQAVALRDSQLQAYQASTRFTRAHRLWGLCSSFYRHARSDGLRVALSRSALFLGPRLANRLPRAHKRFLRVMYLAGKFVTYAQTRGLRSALRRAGQTMTAEIPVLRRIRARKVAEAFEAEMSKALEPRRIVRKFDESHPPFAMLVSDFHDGGLEKVVTDLAKHFLRQGILCPILVVGSAGRAAAHASSIGCDVRVFGGDVDKIVAYAQKMRIKAILTHHCYDAIERLSQAGTVVIEVIHNAYHWQRNDPYLTDLRARCISSYVAVSDFVRDYATAYLSIDANRIHLIENGLSREGLVRPPLRRLMKERKATLETPVLVHLANAHPQKNHLAILEAFEIVRKDYPAAQLVFAGAVDDTSEIGRCIHTKIASKGLEASVRCVGPLGRRELSHLLAGAHVALLPSGVEGFSIASLEYTYFGLPTVLSETGAARRLAKAHQHIVIADNVALSPAQLEPESIDRRSKQSDGIAVSSIASAILTVLSNYDRYADHAEKAGLAWRSYSIEATGQRYLDLVKEMAQ